MLKNVSGPSSFISFRCTRAGLLVVLFTCWSLCGCGKAKEARLTSAETARQALDVALTAWQNGRAAGKIETTSPPVQVLDSIWSKGRKLDSYEVLSEETEADGLRWFSVRLNMQGPQASEVARYVVLGRSPVWVYRQEDYKQTRSWKGMK